MNEGAQCPGGRANVQKELFSSTNLLTVVGESFLQIHFNETMNCLDCCLILCCNIYGLQLVDFLFL